MVYLDFDDVLYAHSQVIEKSGGSKGVLNGSLLRGCLDFIRNGDYYPNFEDKLVHLVYTIAKNHAFVDGNKRTSISSGALFMAQNGYSETEMGLFVEKMENLILHVVQNDFSKAEMQKFISDYLELGELSAGSLEIYQQKGIDPNELPS